MANGISIEFSNVKEVLDGIKEKEGQLAKAVNSAVNELPKRIQPPIKAAVAGQYTIKKKEIGDAYKGQQRAGSITISGVTVNNIKLKYSGRQLTPIHFKMTPKNPTIARGKKRIPIPGENVDGSDRPVLMVAPPKARAISLEIKKGQKKTLSGKYSTPPFLASNGGDGYIPFQRKDNSRDLVSIKTLSIPQMLSDETVEEEIREQINTVLDKRIAHYIERYNK